MFYNTSKITLKILLQLIEIYESEEYRFPSMVCIHVTSLESII